MARTARRALSVVPCQERLASSRRSWASSRRSTAWAVRWACGPSEAGVQSVRRRHRFTPRVATGPLRGNGAPHAAGAATTAVWSPPGRLARPCRVPGGATGPHRAFSSSGPRGESTAPLCSWERVAATPDVSLPSRRCTPSAPGSLARAPWLPWHTRHRPAPRFPYRRPRPRSPSGNRPRRPWSGQSPAVSLPGSAAPRPPGRGAPCAGLARWCPAATGGRRPARPATSTGHRGQRRRPGRQTAPPLPPGAGFFDRLGARHHGGHDARGAQGKDGPRVSHVIRRMLSACVIDTAQSCKGKPWSIS